MGDRNLGYSLILLDISDFPTRHNYVLALWQIQFEPILADWVDELGVRSFVAARWWASLKTTPASTSSSPGDTSLRAEYLVGCDGGHSLIRKAAGIDFAGLDPSTSWLITEVEMDEEPQFGIRHDSIGTHGLNRMGDGGPIRIVLTERQLEHTGDPSTAGRGRRPSGQQDITREPPGHLPRRTTSRRCPSVAQHHGASRAQQARRLDEPRRRIAAMLSGPRAASSTCNLVRSGHSGSLEADIRAPLRSSPER